MLKTASSEYMKWKIENITSHLRENSIKILQGLCPLEKVYEILQKVLHIIPVLSAEKWITET